jgi:hypothetical protein
VIEALDDHPGPHPQSVVIEGGRVLLRMRREPMTRADWTTHDYNVHFCVGLANRASEPAMVELEVEGGHWDDLPDRAPLIYCATAPDGPYVPANFAARTDLKRRYAVRVPLAAGESIYLANTMVRPLAGLEATFQRLGAAADAERRVFGRSLEGRDLVAYLVGDVRRHPTILLVSGIHPPEPDTLATDAALEWLATAEGRALASRFAVAVVPLANPDGYALGTQGSNAAHINFFWHFDYQRPDRCPEAAALWQFARDLAPRGYVDYHCYTFQLGKLPGPYLRPPAFLRDDAARRAAAAFARDLCSRPGTKGVAGFSAYAPSTLGAMLAEQFDTVTASKYHLHLAEGENGCRRRGVDVLVTLARCLADAGLDAVRPANGGRRSRPLYLRAREVWAGLIRPSLGLVRRGRFSELEFRRSGLVKEWE